MVSLQASLYDDGMQVTGNVRRLVGIANPTNG